VSTPEIDATAAGDQLAAGDSRGLARAASADLEALARDMLSRFIKTSDGYRARVGQVQIARWTEQLEQATQPVRASDG
jgi:hypothetical protein